MIYKFKFYLTYIFVLTACRNKKVKKEPPSPYDIDLSMKDTLPCYGMYDNLQELYDFIIHPLQSKKLRFSAKYEENVLALYRGFHENALRR